MRTKTAFLFLPLCLLGLTAATRPDGSGVNAEGFVQKWLVLAPIPIGENVSGADAVDKEHLKAEAKLAPKAGDKAKAGDKELTWKEHTAGEHLLDFNAILGNTVEDSVAYAVSYVVANDDLKSVKMKTGSDDQCKVYLNGKEVFKVTDARPADKDQDTTEVALMKGVNVLVVKVVNEKVDWAFCVRFTDKDDKPITTLKAQFTK